MFRRPEISFMPFQNASSRLTLVLWPATTIERLTTGDFMTRLRRRYDADPANRCRAPCEVRLLSVRIWYDQIARGWFQPASQLLCAALVFSLGSNLSRAPC